MAPATGLPVTEHLKILASSLAENPNSDSEGRFLAHTSLYGETIIGRKDPVQSKGGRLKDRPLPFCVTKAQVWAPGL